MELRRNLLLSVGTLVVLNLMFAFGAIGLFGRMGPAIARILQENVYSLEACEAMLAELALAKGSPVGQNDRTSFMEALHRVENNITDTAERPVIERIKGRADEALDGNAGAIDDVVADVGVLIRVNRAAMSRVDKAAQRLGRAGAWAAVFIGLISFVLSLFVLRYFDKRIIAPMEQIHDVLEASRRGDIHRRCWSHGAPGEIKEVMQSVNALLDEKGTRRAQQNT